MYNNYDYPCGTDEPNAPWNQEEHIESKTVTVSVTISKTFDIDVIDDEDIRDAFKRQVVIPTELPQVVNNYIDAQTLDTKIVRFGLLKDAIKDCKDWHIDELEVIEE